MYLVISEILTSIFPRIQFKFIQPLLWTLGQLISHKSLDAQYQSNILSLLTTALRNLVLGDLSSRQVELTKHLL